MARTKHTISVGCAALDAEHEMQLGLVVALQRALVKGRGRAAIADLLGQLIGFTNAHHQAEQLLMRLYAYPHYTAHTEEHERLIARLKTLQEQFQQGEVEMTVEAGEIVGQWLIDHIRGADNALGQYLGTMR